MVESQLNAPAAPNSCNFWKISWMVPRLPRRMVRAEAARPPMKACPEPNRRSERFAYVVEAEDSSSSPVLPCWEREPLSVRRFQPIENAQMPTIANNDGRIKLYAIVGTIPSNFT